MKEYKIDGVTITEEQLNQLIKQKENQGKKWKPNHLEKYWGYNVNYKVFNALWEADTCDYFKYRNNNCFKTREEAVKALKRIEALHYIREYIWDNDFELIPDWSDDEQKKFYVMYSHRSKLFTIGIAYFDLNLELPYLKTVENWNQVIDNCKEEMEIVFGV